MRVLVGCEESGKVRDAFNRIHGIMAWSCDLIPSRNGGPHLQKNIWDAIEHDGPWDIIILYPPCDYLCNSGNRWYGKGMPGYEKRLSALEWTVRLWDHAQTHTTIGCAIENPTGVLWGKIGKPQYIQPWQFGHGETKRTGILTCNLPSLKPTAIVDGREQRIWKMAPSPTRKRDRSETYQGIADAKADQWGRALIA